MKHKLSPNFSQDRVIIAWADDDDDFHDFGYFMWRLYDANRSSNVVVLGIYKNAISKLIHIDENGDDRGPTWSTWTTKQIFDDKIAKGDLLDDKALARFEEIFDGKAKPQLLGNTALYKV